MKGGGQGLCDNRYSQGFGAKNMIFEKELNKLRNVTDDQLHEIFPIFSSFKGKFLYISSICYNCDRC